MYSSSFIYTSLMVWKVKITSKENFYSLLGNTGTTNGIDDHNESSRILRIIDTNLWPSFSHHSSSYYNWFHTLQS